MLSKIFENTQIYTQQNKKDIRKKKGQFFTSQRSAEFMGKLVSCQKEVVSILEPGAGNASLTAAVIMKLADIGICKKIQTTFVENDTVVYDLLLSTISIIEHFCYFRGIQFEHRIVNKNFLITNNMERFDIVVCNPPYMKIRKDSDESKAMSQFIYGQPNMYALFMVKGIQLLNEGGEFIYIVPRSWTSGLYFKAARKYILDETDIRRIHIFTDRKRVFSDENVLQETMIIYGSRKSQTNSITISSTEEDSFSNIFTFDVEASSIKGVGGDNYLLIPENMNEYRIIQKMCAMNSTFESLGYMFKTGPVVEFRNKEKIFLNMKENTVPMYRSANITGHGIVFPAETCKAQFVSASESNLLIPNHTTVMIRRLSAKEERRRIQASIYRPIDCFSHISAENHINYVVRKDGKEMSDTEAEWIYNILSSDDYDNYFRIVNGSTQVNAHDLNILPVMEMST